MNLHRPLGGYSLRPARRGFLYRETDGAEDASIVENVRIGLESRACEPGPLELPPEVTAESEHAVTRFQVRYPRAAAH